MKKNNNEKNKIIEKKEEEEKKKEEKEEEDEEKSEKEEEEEEEEKEEKDKQKEVNIKDKKDENEEEIKEKKNNRCILMNILLNLYDLDEKIINLFLNDNWLKLYNNLYKSKNSSYKIHELILTLFYFLFSHDKTYITYMKFIKNKPKYMFKFFIRIYQSLGGCCCAFYYNSTINGYIMENFDLLIKVISRAESLENIDYDLIKAVYQFKMDITQHFIDEIGKNSYIFFFRRFARHLRNEDIFALFCKPENLEKNLFNKTEVYSHMIDELDKFAFVCESPSIFINALNFILNRENLREILQNKQIFTTMVKCIFIVEDYTIKENIFKIIFIKLLDMLLDPIKVRNMPKISVLFQPFLDKDDPEILKIYYNNNFFNAGKILPEAIKLFIKENYYGYNLKYLCEILNSLVKVGEAIKQQSYAKNINPLIIELNKNNAKDIIYNIHYASETVKLLKK